MDDANLLVGTATNNNIVDKPYRGMPVSNQDGNCVGGGGHRIALFGRQSGVAVVCPIINNHGRMKLT